MKAWKYAMYCVMPCLSDKSLIPFVLSSNCWVILLLRQPAKSPEPCGEQNIQPSVPTVPSLLGHEKPASTETLYTF